MNQDQLKQLVAEAALEQVRPDLHSDVIIGIGTGSTANKFIDLLAPLKNSFRGAVSSSQASTERLQAIGIEVFDLNDAGLLGVYVDGADEADHHLNLIKGGGAALTREKIVAACRETGSEADRHGERNGERPVEPVRNIPGHVTLLPLHSSFSRPCPPGRYVPPYRRRPADSTAGQTSRYRRELPEPIPGIPNFLPAYRRRPFCMVRLRRAGRKPCSITAS